MRLLSAARSGVLDASQRVGSLTATSPPQFPSVFVEFVVRRRDDLPPRRSRHGSLPALRAAGAGAKTLGCPSAARSAAALTAADGQC